MMATLIIQDWNFSRDFRSIKYGATAGYNLLRAAGAGVVLGMLMLFFPAESRQSQFLLPWWLAPLLWPIAYVVIFLPIGLILRLAARAIPIIAFPAVAISLCAVTLGDPLVCLLKAIVPRAVPADEPPLFSLSLLNLVLDASRFAIAGAGTPGRGTP